MGLYESDIRPPPSARSAWFSGINKQTEHPDGVPEFSPIGRRFILRLSLLHRYSRLRRGRSYPQKLFKLTGLCGSTRNLSLPREGEFHVELFSGGKPASQAANG